MYDQWLQKIEQIPATQLKLDDFTSIIDFVQAQPQFNDDFIQLAQTIGQRGYLELKHQLFEQSLAIETNDQLIYEIIRDELLWQNNDSVRHWLDLLANPESYQAQLLEAEWWQATKEYALAIERYRQLIQLEPTDWRAYRQLADLYDQLDMKERAQTYYQILVDYFDTQLDLSDVRLRLAAYSLNSELIDVDEIESLVEESEEQSVEALLILAQAEAQSQNYDEALRLINEILSQDNDQFDAYELMAEIAYTTHQDELLYQALTWLFETLPTDDARMYSLIQMAHQRQLIDELLFKSIKESAFFIDDAFDLLRVLQWLTTYLLSANQIQAAEQLVEEFVDLLSDPEALSYLYGLIYLAQGHNDLALSAFDLAYEYQLIPIDALTTYFELMLDMGELESLQAILKTNTQLEQETIDYYEDQLNKRRIVGDHDD